MTFKKKIERLYTYSSKIDLTKNKKIFVYSDCHRGSGDNADDFKHNYNLFKDVINNYVSEGYILIELGDGDELWENNRIEDIFKTYRDIFDLYNSLAKKKKFYYIWGNHNRQWKNYQKINKKIQNFINQDFFINSFEGLKLIGKKKTIFLLHGHQGELINDKFWWIGKFFVKIFWRPIQLKFGLPDVTSAAKNYKIRIKADKRFIKWVKNTGIPVIIGHTHRPMFPKKNQVSYFNSGSCIHPKGVSGIEISDDKIRLVKWILKRNENREHIKRNVLAGPIRISDL